MELIKIHEHLYVPTDFDTVNHNYYADPEGKQRYSGITTVLGVLAKPALIPWAARMACEYVEENLERMHNEPLTVLAEAKVAHTKKKEAAGAHGTDAHALVEEYINFALLSDGKPYNPAVLMGDKATPIQPFVKWAEENVDKFLFSERRMANRDIFVAGTADFAYLGKDGRRYMADFKTSSGIYGVDYWCQVAAYRYMAEEEGDAPYDGLAIIRLGKKGPWDFEVQYMFEYETFRDAFLACLKIYRAQSVVKGMVVK